MLIAHTAFLFVPGGLITIFNQAIRPGVYAFLAIGMFVYMGWSSRPAKNAYQSNIAALIALVMYISMVMVSVYVFGGGRNAMTLGISPILRNMWTMGIPLVLSEIVRYRLIKVAGSKYQAFVVVALSIVYAFANTGGTRVLFMETNPNILHFVFASALPALTVSVVVSFVAMKGSVFAALLISFVYNLGESFFPILPSFDRLVWSLVVCGLMFVVGVIHHYMTDEDGNAQRKRASRVAKHSRKGPFEYIMSIGLMGLIIAFFLQLFPIYPVVILTGSMTGTIDRGSMVIMRRIPAEEAFMRVQKGSILHYNFRNVEFVHRVIDFTYTNYGVRKYITQGDANESPDPLPVLQEDVLGTPIFHIPFIGYPNVIFRAMFGGIFQGF